MSSSAYPLATLDTLVSFAVSIILPHPLLSMIAPLCVRAVGHRYSHPSFIVAFSWFAAVCAAYALKMLDARLAFGRPRQMKWEDEVVLVTGGASERGLGRLLAEVWAARGVTVAVLDILDPETCRDDAKRRPGLAAELEACGITYFRCDVGDKVQVEQARVQVERECGPVTVLINNAAVVNAQPVLHLTPEQIEQTYKTNVLAHYNTTQAFLPGMLARKHGGHIVTISSVLGDLGCAGLSAYTSSKAAATALHHSLTAELYQMASTNPSTSPSSSRSSSPSSSTPTQQYPESIRTILVAPGALTTPLFRTLLASPTLNAFPRAFLAPQTQTALVAARVVELIDQGMAGEVRVPLYSAWIGVFWLLPVGARAVVRRWSGLDRVGWVGWRDFGEGLGQRVDGDEPKKVV